MAQRRSNRHGNFLIVEEFYGRRRSGTILIPEGRYGQGWERFIKELQWAILSLGMVRGAKKEKAEKERWSSLEEMELKVVPEEECFGPFPEPIDRVPRWKKEVSIGVSKPGHDSVMHLGTSLATTYKEAAVKMVPKGRKVLGENTVEVASGVQHLEWGSALNSDPEKLMGGMRRVRATLKHSLSYLT